MPIRRGAHGKIVEQPTEPVGHRREAADVSSAEAPTEPIKPDPSDSLFAAEAPPAPAGSSKNDQMEAATVVIGGGDSPTRVVRPRRRRPIIADPAGHRPERSHGRPAGGLAGGGPRPRKRASADTRKRYELHRPRPSLTGAGRLWRRYHLIRQSRPTRL